MRETAAGERGYMLMELIVAAAIGLVFIGAASTLMFTSLRSANAASSRTIATRQAELFLARLTRELREAQNVKNATTGADLTPVNTIYTSTSSSVSFFLPNPGSAAKGFEVTWACTAGASCTRTVKGSAAVTELTNVESVLFTPYSSKGSILVSGAGASIAAAPQYPSSIQLMVSVKDVSQLDSEHSHVVPGVTNPITVQDGVSLRNYAS
jgi:Tfp pilus assembly protein PilW